MRINNLSQEGERQLVVDIVYIRKLIGQFLAKPAIFETLDTIMVGVLSSKKDAENKTCDEILEDP